MSAFDTPLPAFAPPGGMQRRFAAPIAYDPNTGAPADGGPAWTPPVPTYAPRIYDPANGDAPPPVDPARLGPAANLGRGLVSGTEGIPAGLYGLGANVAGALGAPSLARGMYRRGQAWAQDAAKDAPVSFEQARQTGAWGDWLAGAAGELAPTLASIALTKGVGGAVGRRVVAGAASRAAEDAATSAVDRSIANGTFKAPEGIAADQTPEAAQAAARQAAIEAGTQARLPTAARAFAPAYETAGKIGSNAGEVAGVLPMGTAQVNAADADQNGNLDFGQEASMKRLVGSLPAAVVNVLPFHAFFGRMAEAGAPVVGDAIAKDAAQKFLPALAKRARVSAAQFGAAGGASQAIALATHRWVQDNYSQLTPAEFGSVLRAAGESAAQGAVLGGFEAARAHMPDLGVHKALDWLDDKYDALRSRLGKGGQPVGEGAMGEPPGGAPAATYFVDSNGVARPSLDPEAVGGLSGLYSKLKTGEARDALRDAFAEHYENLKGNVGAAGDTLKSVFDNAFGRAKTPAARTDLQTAYADVQAPQEPAGDTFQRHLQLLGGPSADAGEADEDVGTPEAQQAARTQRPDNAPFQLDTPLQNILASYIPHDNILWSHPKALESMVASGEKLFTGERLTGHDQKALRVLRSIVGDSHVDAWQRFGPTIWNEHFLAIPDSEHVDEEPQTALGAELQRAFDERDAQQQAAKAGPEEGPPSDDQNEAPEGVVEAAAPGRHSGVFNESTLAQQLDQAQPGTPEHATLQAQLRDQIDRQGALFTENRSTEAARGKWATKDPSSHANTIEIEPKTLSGGATRRQALQLDNLISKKMGEPDNVGNTSPKEALLQVLQDIAASGHKIKLSSITPGVFYTDGADNASQLTPEDVLAIKYGLGSKAVDPKAGATAYADLMAELGHTRADGGDGRTAPLINEPFSSRLGAPKVGFKEDDHPNAPLHTATEHLDPTTEMRAQDVEGAEGADSRVDTGEFGPRRPPPGAPETTSAGDVFGAARGNVARANLKPSPYEKIVNQARRDHEAAKTPAARGRIKHEAGVKIGEAELAKERENGTISDKRFATELHRLHDYGSGSSRKYLMRAARGDFDSGRITEVGADNPEVDRAALSAERRATGWEDAGTDASAPPSRAEAATNAEQARQFGEIHRNQVANRKLQAELDAEKQRGEADRDIDIGIHAATSPDTPHDHEKETRMANALLDRLGVKNKVRIVPLTGKGVGRKAGLYTRADTTIHINPNLKGGERWDVIAHELGHHIIHETIGADYEKASPELRDAILKDHLAWMKEHYGSSELVSDVLSSRKPFFRGQAMNARSEGKLTGELDSGKFQYLYSDNEWLADNIARALQKAPETHSIVEKFFAGVANKLRALWQRITGTPEGAKYAPAKSVEDWVQGLFDKNRADAAEALDRPVSKQEAADATAAALHLAYEGASEPIPSSKALMKVAEPARGGSGAEPPPGGNEPPPGGGDGAGRGRGFDAFTRFLNYQLMPSQRRILMRALDRRVIMRQVTKRYGADEALMQQLENPETHVQTLAHLAYKMWARGELNVGTHPSEVLRAVKTAMLRMLGIASNSQEALKMFEDMHSGLARQQQRAYDVRAQLVKDKAGTPSEHTQAMFNLAATMGRHYIYDPWRRLAYGYAENVEQMQIPTALKIAAMEKRHTGEVGPKGRLQATWMQRQRFANRFEDALQGLDKDQITAWHQAMQTRAKPEDVADLKVREALAKGRAVFEEAHQYAKKAGLDLGHQPDYYPASPDPHEVAKRLDEFKAMLNQPKFEDAIRAKFADKNGKPSKEKLGVLVDRLAQTAAQGRGDVVSQRPIEERTAPERAQLMDFIYKHGSPEDIKQFAGFQPKDPASVLHRYIDNIVNRAEYTRRYGEHGEGLEKMLAAMKDEGASDADVEYMKDYVATGSGTYGANGSPLVTKLLSEKLAGKINGILMHRRTQGVQDLLMAYQNARVLPLTLLSSLVDPGGIAIRMGGLKDRGDFGAFFKGLHDGIVAAAGGKSQQHLRDLYRALSIADDYLTTENLTNGMGSDQMSGLARKISDATFKLNLMTPFTKATRLMALAMGQHFLLKHAAGAEPGVNGSARYLRELGVNATDIQPGVRPGSVRVLSDAERANAKPGELARDDRVRDALNRFVDESILRTDASQAPRWVHDPALQLVAQYKRFAFSFADQILGRISHELHYNNFHVLGPALAYIPVTIMAEMVRGLIQYGPGGNPYRRDWGAMEWIPYAAQRAGMLGPRAAQGLDSAEQALGLEAKGYSGFMSPGSDLGPTASQVKDTIHAIEGKKSIEGTALEALPGSAVFQHWSASP